MNLKGGKRCDAYGKGNDAEKCKWVIYKLTCSISFNYTTHKKVNA